MISPKLKLSLKEKGINWENNIVRPEHHALLQIVSSKKQHPNRAVMLWKDSGDYSPFMMCPLRQHWFSCIKYPCCMLPSSSSYHSVVPCSRGEQQFAPACANAHNIQCPPQRNSWYSRLPTSTSCSTRSGSSTAHSHWAQVRSTKTMLPHTRIVKFLKMYLECHGGKKTIAGKRNVVHNSHTCFTRKIQ